MHDQIHGQLNTELGFQFRSPLRMTLRQDALHIVSFLFIMAVAEGTGRSRVESLQNVTMTYNV